MLNNSDIVRNVAEKKGYSQDFIQKVFDAWLEEISLALEQDDEVVFKSFGKFRVHRVTESLDQDLERRKYKKKPWVRFTPSKVMIQAIRDTKS